MSSLLALNNARTTLQRVSDAKFFSGWVKRISPQEITFLVHTACLIAPGDEFAFQVYGNGHDAFFRGKAVSVVGAEPGPLFAMNRASATSLEVNCDILGSMALRDARGHPRFHVSGVTAQINPGSSEDGQRDIIIDIGPVGFSILTAQKLKKSQKVDLFIYTKDQTIECRAEVRNCITYSLNNEYQRVGMQIEGMTRIDARRWKELYSEILQASKITWFVSTMDNSLNQRSRRSA